MTAMEVTARIIFTVVFLSGLWALGELILLLVERQF